MLGLITLLAKSCILLTNLGSSPLFAKESFTFSAGEKISILSDKALKKGATGIYHAMGNVVISHYDETLYGETATYDINKGEMHVKGNVRYVGPEYSVYGSELFYYVDGQRLKIKNARVISSQGAGSFTIVGKEISRITQNQFEAIDAEYTTCRDCPESWSVYGDRVTITKGDYVRIYQALLKVNGVTVMYLPFAFFPIKKGRQTGLLFPKIKIGFTEGVGYEQPFFWALGDSYDMTFYPGVHGKRGLIHGHRYRQSFGDRKWLELSSFVANDRIYLPEKGNNDDQVSGDHFFRFMGDAEYHFSFGNWFNHHFYFNDVKDMDMVRDYSDYTDRRVLGAEYGGSTFMEWRTGTFDLTAEGIFSRNNIYPDPLGYDDHTVQVLPAVTLNLLPRSIIQTDIPMLNQLIIGSDAEITRFQQNNIKEGAYLRNADRLLFRPYADWHFLGKGGFELKSRYQWETNHYQFPTLKDNNSVDDQFIRESQLLTSEFSFSLERIFGLAFKEHIPIDEVNLLEIKKAKKNKYPDVIGHLPELSDSITENYVVMERASYRHSQQFKFVHHHLLEEQLHGNDAFGEQIKDGKGWFDLKDATLKSQHTFSQDISKDTSISKKNTVELQWNNYLVKKSAKKQIDPNNLDLYDQFSYAQIANFNISQGYELNDDESNFKKNLTRLHVSTSYSVERFTFSFSDFYFHDNDEHVLGFGVGRTFDRGKIDTKLNYNPISEPLVKTFHLTSNWAFNDLIDVSYNYEHDLVAKQSNKTTYGLSYKPHNNCWRIQFAYNIDKIDRSYTINFFLNFADGNFTPITGY